MHTGEEEVTVVNATQQPVPSDRYPATDYLLAILQCLLILATVAGNTAVITASATSHQLKSQLSTKFIVNLAITDLSNSLLVMLPSLVSLLYGDWPFGLWACRLQCAANYTLIIVSMLTLAMVSIDRYNAVLKPLHYHDIITTRVVHYMIAYSWLQGFVFAFVPVALNWIHYDYFEIVCAIDWFTSKNAYIYVIVAFIMCFKIPGFILIYSYTKIITEIRKKMKRTGDSGVNNEDKRMQRTLRSLIVVVIIFYICMTPFCVTKLVKVISGDEYFVPGVINSLASSIQYLASATNPLVYGIFRKEYRDAFRLQLAKLTWYRPSSSVGRATSSGQSNGRTTSSGQSNGRPSPIGQSTEPINSVENQAQENGFRHLKPNSIVPEATADV